jgi:hypothetical protein
MVFMYSHATLPSPNFCVHYFWRGVDELKKMVGYKAVDDYVTSGMKVSQISTIFMKYFKMVSTLSRIVELLRLPSFHAYDVGRSGHRFNGGVCGGAPRYAFEVG